MRTLIKKFAPLMLINLLAFYSGYLFYTRQTLQQRQPQQRVVVKITPQYESDTNSCYVNGMRMSGATRATLHKRIGKPMITQGSATNPRGIDVKELLDNAYVWVGYYSPSNRTRESEDWIIDAVWFDFENFSTRYNKKLYLTWEYRGKTYLLDETTTPEVLIANFSDAESTGPPYTHNEKSFFLCEKCIVVDFKGSKIGRVSVRGLKEPQ